MAGVFLSVVLAYGLMLLGRSLRLSMDAQDIALLWFTFGTMVIIIAFLAYRIWSLERQIWHLRNEMKDLQWSLKQEQGKNTDLMVRLMGDHK